MVVFSREQVKPLPPHVPGKVTVHGSFVDAEDKHNTQNPREDS